MRLFLFAVLAGTLLTGCSRSDTRSADPQDWRIGADDGGELQEWLDTNIPLMPDELAQEFALCFSNIKATTYTGPDREPMSKPNQLARHLDGRTVRDVLIEGNEAGVRLMELRVKAEADALVRLVNSTDGTNAWETKAIDRQRTVVEALKTRLTKAQDHLTELHAGGLRP